MNAMYLVYAGGAFTAALAVFHLMFWRLFRWKSQLSHLHPINRAVMQALNLCLTFVFVLVAYLCFFHAGELISTPLGRSLLAGLSALWLFRMALQPVFFSAHAPLSWAFVAYFLVGAMLFGVPLAL